MPKACKPRKPIPADPAAKDLLIAELQNELDARRKTKREAMQRFRAKQADKKYSTH